MDEDKIKLENLFKQYAWSSPSELYFNFWGPELSGYESFFSQKTQIGDFKEYRLSCISDIHIYKHFKPSVITSTFTYKVRVKGKNTPTITDKDLKDIEQKIIESNKFKKIYRAELKKLQINKDFTD